MIESSVIYRLSHVQYSPASLLPQHSRLLLNHQVFRSGGGGGRGGFFHWLDRIVVGLFFVAQKAAQIEPSKGYQIGYHNLIESVNKWKIEIST